MNAPLKTTTLKQNRVDILPHLQKVKRVGEGRYLACCPVHDDKNPSMTVTVKPDGVVVMYCHACGAKGLDIVNALGIDPSALFPLADNPRYEKQQRSGFSAWQLLHALEKDLLVVLIAINDFLLNGKKPCQSDVDYLTDVCKRINEALQYLEGRK
ncbi:CHC2 zinc finger domain-containing protein [Nitrosomonas communis]|uniref:CHC2 zinc finger domain-containing protein n=1 Tax=Nitrosomonas communis TaxID=44574 RepID=UPI0026EF9BD7|nr:CHC2 zinc finger domain-containing protein [Nitrosomonas communis]MCO6428240.1 hypothetical protein [Nitrosomonas communis]